MVIDQLLEVLRPPNTPSEGGPNLDWSRVANMFGMALPTDYMMFIERYGSGEIGSWLTVFNPFTKNPNISLTEQFFRQLSSLSQLKEEFPESCPFPLLYEPGGLLPWGISIDGDIFCWQTKGASGRWPVIALGRHTDPEIFPFPFSQFLANSIAGEITFLAMPVGWKAGSVKFVPYAL